MKTNTFPLIFRILSYMIMGGFTIMTIGPLLWLFYSSFKPHAEIVKNALALPELATASNYVIAWVRGNLGLYMNNSIVYTFFATSGTVIFALACGFGFSKFPYKKTTAFFLGYLTIGLLITVHAVLVPLFIIESKIGLGNTRIGLIIPYIAFGLPMAVYLAYSYIVGIPNSLIESALIDGANYLRIFIRIIVPIATPVTATMTILTFLANWNEFVLAFILTSSDKLRSLTVGINAFAGSLVADFGLQFASLVIGTAPVLIFYTIFHEKIVKGFAEGALKE
ncbi:MAG: carbohydrate ABC transporter permease [Spirochaetota bacterium]